MDVNLATALLVTYMLIYVLPFYLFPTMRPSASRTRDAIPVMRARIRSVIISCCICSTITLSIVAHALGNASLTSLLRIMGYLPLSFPEIYRSLLLTSLLFIGPLFEKGFVESGWKDWIRLTGLYSTLSSWTGWRNFVVGPITEELLFRSASIPLLLVSRVSASRMILQTPFIFGLAHFHHFYEFCVTHPRASLTLALSQSILQFSYTTAFGGYAVFVYLRTGNLLSVIVVHAFCNWMGFPRLWGTLGGQDRVPLTTSHGEMHLPPPLLASLRSPTLWYTSTYYFLLIVGPLAWWKLLWPLTDSENCLIDF